MSRDNWRPNCDEETLSGSLRRSFKRPVNIWNTLLGTLCSVFTAQP